MKRIRQKLLVGNSIALLLLFCTCSVVRAQGSFQVKGTVKGVKGEALIGATVKLKGLLPQPVPE